MKTIFAVSAALVVLGASAWADDVPTLQVKHKLVQSNSESTITGAKKAIELELPVKFGIRHAAEADASELVNSRNAKGGTTGNQNIVAAVDSADLAAKAILGHTLSGMSVGAVGLSLVSSIASGLTMDALLPKRIQDQVAKYNSPEYFEVVSSKVGYDVTTIEAHQEYLKKLGFSINEKTDKSVIFSIGDIQAGFSTTVNWSPNNASLMFYTGINRIQDRAWTFTSPVQSATDLHSAITYAGYSSFDDFLAKAKAELPSGWSLVYYIDAGHRGVFRNGAEQVQAVLPDPRKPITIAQASN